ncbi:MAG: SUMF1/EgtB/PvdO family nonheme iron enzyme [Magnetococcales bacterium]|nr:SUMF1/EgtB/PvdO family nonheme iron enzyme [Magnetococcales bacterium]
MSYVATKLDGSPLPSWLRFDRATRTFSGNPPQGTSYVNVKIIASDGRGGSTNTTFRLNINTANDAPEIRNSIPDQSWRRGKAYSFQLPPDTFRDRDGDSMYLTARLASGSALPSWLRFTPSTRTFAGTPPTGVSALSVVVSANDNHGGIVRDTFVISFYTNRPPVAVSDAITVNNLVAITDTLSASDPDQDQLSYAIIAQGSQGTATITNRATGAFTYTPHAAASGSDIFTFQVNDGRANSNIATVTVTFATSQNSPPVATDGTLKVGEAMTATGMLTATDAEDDTLTYRIIANGSKGVVTITNPATGAYSYTPSAGVSGTDTFTFSVRDGQLDSNTGTVSVEILPVEVTNSLGMRFRLIPSGSFRMGSPETESGRSLDEGPQHTVIISRSFYMQTTEVTQEQWKLVMGNNPSYFVRCGDNCPVESVSWNTVQSFLTTLNGRQEGSYRLPTEAEREYATRAGTTTRYAFGTTSTNLGNHAWYHENSSDMTHPVAQKLPNPWGLYDMYGNVWEWVSDWYSATSYTSATETDPQGPLSGTKRSHRGGGWDYGSSYLRTANRGHKAPDVSYYSIGFRLVKVP